MNRKSIRTDTRNSGIIDRYHTWPTINRQSVGEHSWQVLRIYIEIFGPPEPSTTEYIVFHDSAELITGDPPFPIKSENPDLKEIYTRIEEGAIQEMRGEGLPELSEREAVRVKVCDLLEMHEFGKHEMLMGNQYAIPIVNDTVEAAAALSRDRLFAQDQKAVDKYMKKRMMKYG